VKRAVELFTFERRSARSPLVELAYRTQSEPEDEFISVAESHWEMVVTRQNGGAQLTVRGPEPKARTASIPQEAEFFGVGFTHGTFMPVLPPGRLIDRPLTLAGTGNGSFWFDGYRLELPTPENVDLFVERLVRLELLEHDRVAAAAVEGEAQGLSTRSVERRVSRATGLTRGLIRQIRRAGHAVELLSSGVSPLEVVHFAGYADQPHLTRSLKRLVGQTPSEIAS
jgi:Helix-turn-helix domain